MCIDAEPEDFKAMMKNCLTTKDSEYETWKDKLAEVFTPQPTLESTFVSLSVRSTWDLYFQVRNFPRGTEVLMTAINLPDMINIVESHGCVPVPVDLCPRTMAPTLDAIKAATTEHTKVFLFAYIFGVTYDVAPFADYLHSQKIEIL